jgi:hypothetical protein
MKTIFSSKWLRIAAGAVLAAAVAVSCLAFAPAVVQAQSGGPVTQTTPPVKGEKRSIALERAYAREQARLKLQGSHLDRAGKAAGKLDALIVKAKSNGRDVTALESALIAFRAQVVIARTDHDQAASILAAHAGFDASGKVTDAATAKQTVDSAHKSLADAGTVLQQAAADLHSAVRAWREANPPIKKTPQP